MPAEEQREARSAGRIRRGWGSVLQALARGRATVLLWGAVRRGGSPCEELANVPDGHWAHALLPATLLLHIAGGSRGWKRRGLPRKQSAKLCFERVGWMEYGSMCTQSMGLSRKILKSPAFDENVPGAHKLHFVAPDTKFFSANKLKIRCVEKLEQQVYFPNLSFQNRWQEDMIRIKCTVMSVYRSQCHTIQPHCCHISLGWHSMA